MHCKSCGNELPDGVKYCGHCGQAVHDESNNEQINDNIVEFAADEEQRNKLHKRPLFAKWQVILVLLMVVLGVTGILYISHRSKSYIGMEKGTAMTVEEAETALISDISDEEWEIFEASNNELSQIVAKYSNEEGYIDSENADNVLNAVTAGVNELYKDGTVVYYICDESMVYFEYASGLGAFYTPALEGYSSGGNGEVRVLAIDPYETDPTNSSMTNEAYLSTVYITATIDGAKITSLENEEVTFGALKKLSECDILLWNGHGLFITHKGEEYTVLITREQATGLARYAGEKDITLTVNKAVAAVGEVNYWAITPYFVEDYIKIDNGLVYLSTCASGANDRLAKAFLEAGAETVFVNTGATVNTDYTQVMMNYIISYMTSCEDGVFRTAEEALNSTEVAFNQNIIDAGGWAFSDTGNVYSTLQDFVENSQGGAHVEIVGEKDYTIVSCIRGEVTFPDDMTFTEIGAVLAAPLAVRLQTEDLTVLKETQVNTDGTFYFNDLEPEETFYITLYSSGKQVSERIEVKTVEHRYISASLEYRRLVQLEGYVFDQEGIELPGVTVTASFLKNGETYSETVQTDGEGYYGIEMMSGTEGTIEYSKSGYVTVENAFLVRAEKQDDIQAALSMELSDVLLAETMLFGAVVDAETGEGLPGVSVSVGDILCVSDGDGVYTTHVEPGGSYSISFSLDGYGKSIMVVDVQDTENTNCGILALSELPDGIPEGAFEWNGHYYYYYDRSCSWDEAKAFCEFVGGHLVTLTSQEEQSMVYEYALSAGGSKRIFIGLTDAGNEGDWSTWITGEEVVYTNWGTGEPDNYANSSSTQNYAALYTRYQSGATYTIEAGQWDDYNGRCTFICEWELDE